MCEYVCAAAVGSNQIVAVSPGAIALREPGDLSSYAQGGISRLGTAPSAFPSTAWWTELNMLVFLNINYSKVTHTEHLEIYNLTQLASVMFK